MIFEIILVLDQNRMSPSPLETQLSWSKKLFGNYVLYCHSLNPLEGNFDFRNSQISLFLEFENFLDFNFFLPFQTLKMSVSGRVWEPLLSEASLSSNGGVQMLEFHDHGSILPLRHSTRCFRKAMVLRNTGPVTASELMISHMREASTLDDLASYLKDDPGSVLLSVGQSTRRTRVRPVDEVSGMTICLPAKTDVSFKTSEATAGEWVDYPRWSGEFTLVHLLLGAPVFRVLFLILSLFQ